MPRGKYTNHKGKSRRFTNPEEIEEQMKREEKERKWREERGDESSDEGAAAAKEKKSDASGSESDSSEEDSDEGKAKGVGNLIQVENPNRIQKKVKKLSTLNETVKTSTSSKPELSRREREELERQRAQANYQRLHAEGKTEEARADLARLAIIKQQRAEAAKRREEEKKQKEAVKQSKTAQVQKALGKKTT
ncbi:28 kDa heat- and acid-stable phosphoprotein-like isoform X2 [Bacillus rossius redtenbacheri]|uniref:28 kDa heat- and acid-stable phosphoprotein-like isoform X2 n=1 Tax=Bacillus rossius redtenbacheri TaxID=93214 RepID=UPI002FDEA8F3